MLSRQTCQRNHLLQETVWTLSNIQRPLHQLVLLKASIISKVNIILKMLYHLKVLLNLNLKVSTKKVNIKKS